ncbi:MAG TPA: thiamine pyrophosphate-dependent enzyme [Gemmataceae bacterium]
MNRHSRIFVAGGDTLIGAALLELLAERGFENLLSFHQPLTDATAVSAFFERERPEFVFLVGGKSGGIALNRERPADLMLDNLRTITNVLDAAQSFGTTKLLYLASSCAYPKEAPQPLREQSLLSGPLEPTSEAYAMAKLAGWKLCEAHRRQYGCRFITGFPANAFGPHDDFDPASGHVIPALIRRMHDAKLNGDREVTIWGSGSPRREFIYSRDLADACLFVMEKYEGEGPINLGGGMDLSIAEAARTIAEVVGFRGQLGFDATKPDGAPFKALDSSVLLGMGWKPAISFREGIEQTYQQFAQSRKPLAALRPLTDLYRSLYRIRRVEEEVARVYATDKIKSPVHLSIGQEAVSAGICAALKPHDVVFGTYRGHALYLAKGGDLNSMVAELFGKATGCTKGKGGSMHLIDPEVGVMGMSAVVGTTIANAAGYAYAIRTKKPSERSIVVSFFGDGATEEGVFAEAINFAVLKKLPILFVCENNGYAIHTSQARRQGRPDIRARAEAIGVRAERLDGSDVVALARRSADVIGKLRAGCGPWFFEVSTYRWREHVGPGADFHLGFREEREMEPWIAADPVLRLAAELPTRERAAIEREAEAEIAKAFAFAEASPYPEADELMTDIYREDADAFAASSR